MTNQSLMSRAERWNHLLEEFRGFGGVVNNVIQREGKHGLGLFPVNPSLPIELHVPSSLLVSVNNIKLQGNNIILNDKSLYPEGFGAWYERFQAEYSWGAEAQSSIQKLETDLSELPNNINESLRKLGLLNPERLTSSPANIDYIFKRFVQTRRIGIKEDLFLMPIIELINHSPFKPSWIINEQGVTVKGEHDDEILVRYSISDPLRRFIQYGFNCDEPFGFSMFTQLIHRGQKITISGIMSQQPLKAPKVRMHADQIIINSVLLGSSDSPRYPRHLLEETLGDYPKIKSDELFDQILLVNRIKIIQLIKELNKIKTEFSAMLQEACLMQVNMISNNIGKRS